MQGKNRYINWNNSWKLRREAKFIRNMEKEPLCIFSLLYKRYSLKKISVPYYVYIVKVTTQVITEVE